MATKTRWEPLTVEERFWRKVERGDASVCWPWKAARSSGYGVLRVAGRNIRANRLAWELTHGPVPPGLWVLHRCDNPPCCNPAHLFLGSNEDNVRDMQSKGRARPPLPRRGATHPMAKLTLDQVAEIR